MTRLACLYCQVLDDCHCHQGRGSSARSATAILVHNQLLWLLLSFLHTWQISQTSPPCNRVVSWHQSQSQLIYNYITQRSQSYFAASQSIKGSSRKINVRNNILAQILMKLSCHSLVLSLCLRHLSYFFLGLCSYTTTPPPTFFSFGSETRPRTLMLRPVQT